METNLFSFLVFGGIASAFGAAFLAFRDLFYANDKDVSHRRRSQIRVPRSQEGVSKSTLGRFDAWFERSLYMSGLDMNVRTATLLLLVVGLVVGAAFYVLTLNLVLAFVGAVFGFSSVVGYVAYVKRKRLKQFEEHFPAALDLLSRAVRAGESLDQAIELVGNSSPEPVATEFRRCANQLELGLSVSDAMQVLGQRMDLMDVRIFSNTLSVHRETGGNLAMTLERLAEVIRSRMEYHRHLLSVTSAGRFSVYLISSLGPILFAYLFLIQPEYGHKLWDDSIGRMMLIFAVVSQIMGIIWVSRLLKSDY